MQHDPTIYETIEAVRLDFKTNTINFFEKKEDVRDSAQCAMWGIWGDLFIKELNNIPDAFWLPYNQIKPLIAYTNLQLYTTRIDPENSQGERSEANVRILKRELEMALATGSAIDPALRVSIDDQIAAVSKQALQHMLAEQDAIDEDADDRNDVPQTYGQLQDWLEDYRPQKSLKYRF